MKQRPKFPAEAAPKPLRGKKSWREKPEDDKDLPRAVPLRDGTGEMIIAAPCEVDALMRCVPRGKLTTIDSLRAVLAARHGTDTACPITTGIFAWIAAHAADEAAAAGARDITPYWRTLRAKGGVNPKYPGGLVAITARLEAEGHEVFQKGKRTSVRNYEKALVPASAFRKKSFSKTPSWKNSSPSSHVWSRFSPPRYGDSGRTRTWIRYGGRRQGPREGDVRNDVRWAASRRRA